MRTTILPSMLDVLSFNYNHKTEAACMYEMGTVYTPQPRTNCPSRVKRSPSVCTEAAQTSLR